MDGGTASGSSPALVTVGVARLPRSIAGDLSGPLLIELTLDSNHERIVDVATSISLPGYTALLRSLIIGSRIADIDAVAERISEHYRGPLLRPTVAALRNAASNNGKDGLTST